MSGKLYGILQKVLKISPDIHPFALDWYIEVLTHIRDISIEAENGIKALEEVVEEWARWREQNVEIGLTEKLWELKKEMWQKRAEKYGWDYVSTAVVRDFMNELEKVGYDGNIGKIAEIFRLLEVALEKNRQRTVELLIEFIERFYGDIEALRDELERIVKDR
jgi:hypothetical protein